MKIWVTNWQPYSIPHSAMKCIQWTPDAEPAAVLWLIIGCKVTNKWAKHQIYLSIFERENSNSFAWLVQELRDIVSKVIILSERTKSILIFFFWACSTLLNWLRHHLWHLPEKCVLGYVLLLNICDVSYTLATLTWVFSTPLVQEVYLGIPWVILKTCDRLLHPLACWCLGMRTPPFLNLCPCRE